MRTAFGIESSPSIANLPFLLKAKECYKKDIFNLQSMIVRNHPYNDPELFHRLVKYRKRLSAIHACLIRLSYRPEVKPQQLPF